MTGHPKEWEEGRAAKAAGRSANANPNRAGTQQSAGWLAGFIHDDPEQNVDRPVPGEG